LTFLLNGCSVLIDRVHSLPFYDEQADQTVKRRATIVRILLQSTTATAAVATTITTTTTSTTTNTSTTITDTDNTSTTTMNQSINQNTFVTLRYIVAIKANRRRRMTMFRSMTNARMQ
jgi:hypothetical protein